MAVLRFVMLILAVFLCLHTIYDIFFLLREIRVEINTVARMSRTWRFDLINQAHRVNNLKTKFNIISLEQSFLSNLNDHTVSLFKNDPNIHTAQFIKSLTSAENKIPLNFIFNGLRLLTHSYLKYKTWELFQLNEQTYQALKIWVK